MLLLLANMMVPVMILVVYFIVNYDSLFTRYFWDKGTIAAAVYVVVATAFFIYAVNRVV